MKTKIQLIAIAVALTFIFAACGGGESKKTNSDETTTEETQMNDEAMEEINLSEYGIPLTLTVPENAKASKAPGLAELDGVTYVNYQIRAKDFELYVSMPDVDNKKSKEEYLSDQRTSCERQKGFKLISEDANGFLFEKQTMQGDSDFDFRQVVVKDKREIIISANAYKAPFTRENIDRMYKAARSAK